MNTVAEIALHAVGTSEGVKKAWDTRGRGEHPANAVNTSARMETENFLMSKGFKLDQRGEWDMHKPAVYMLKHVPDLQERSENATHTVVVYPDGSWEHFAEMSGRGTGVDRLEKLGFDDVVYPTNVEHLRQGISKGNSAKDLMAYGTSEGLKKAWDARGRGKNTMGERDKSKVRAVQTIKLPSGATFYKGKAVGNKVLTPPSKLDMGHNQPGYVTPGTKIKLPPGRLWPEQAYWKQGTPVADKHPLRGDFRRSTADVNAISNTTFKPIPGATTTIYQAQDIGADKAATVFSSHNAKTGERRIVEFNHGADNRLQYRKQNQNLLSNMGETQVVRFSSENAHSNYLRQRYGIGSNFKS